MFASKNFSLTAPSNNPLGVYTIPRSVRFRSSASANLNRTYTGTGTSATIKTLSMWVKRGTLGSLQRLANSNSALAGTTYLRFNASDNLDFQFESAGGLALTTTQVLRDISSWYHIVLAIDTTQATAANRVKLYLNGSQITSFSAANYPTQNATTSLFGFASAANRIGCIYDATTEFFDGYLAEINHIDGQALTPSSFGKYNQYGVWAPINYTGTYGTNGFYLKFDSYATTAALGTDSSGNSNTWTVNNISVTAGVTYDSMTDVPTLTSAAAANYCTWNTLDKNSTNITISNGSLTASMGAVAESVRATMGMSSGKWYWEVTATAVTTSCSIGILNAAAALNTYVGGNANGWAYWWDGRKVNNGSFTAYGASFTTGDVISVAFDAGAGTLTFYKNGTSQGTAFTGLASGTYFPAYGNGSTTVNANFGQQGFTYTPPTGFVALNTFNLSQPTIPNGAAYMAATTYTGNGSTQSIVNTLNGTSFQPDWVWIKNRSVASSNDVFDVLRGATKSLITNLPNAELTDANGLTAFNSNGFSVGSTASDNGNGNALVGWQWKAGGSGVSNTNGSITSTVSANTTAGFSIVTYTGTGANATVGHGLGVTPSMMIIKNRVDGGRDWQVYHINLTSAAYTLQLDLTAAQALNPTQFNSTAPTSSVFSVGTASATNASTNTFVAYCFAPVAGYSAFGSYTGNGSTDGPFVYLGFRPRFTFIKRTDAIANWRIHDTSRDTYNVASKTLYPNLSNAETSAASEYWDILSNGIKLRTSDAESNASGGTYIYMAFAENPFKYSLAR